MGILIILLLVAIALMVAGTMGVTQEDILEAERLKKIEISIKQRDKEYLKQHKETERIVIERNVEPEVNVNTKKADKKIKQEINEKERAEKIKKTRIIKISKTKELSKKIVQLEELLKDGIITQEEFEDLKNKAIQEV